MIIDCNILFGNWAFRSLEIKTIVRLLEVMDSCSIERGLISSIDAVLYRDCHKGNQELMQTLKEFNSRLFPVAAMNPLYAGWEEDFEISVKEWNVKGVRIYPHYHGFDYQNERLHLLIEKCVESQLPLFLTVMIEDARQRHFLDVKEDLNPAAIRYIAQKYPELKIIITNPGYDFIQETLYGIPEKLWNNLFFDISHVYGPPHDHLDKLIKSFGAERFLFGTFMTFRIPQTSIKKMEMLEIPEEEKEKISSKNLLNIMSFE